MVNLCNRATPLPSLDSACLRRTGSQAAAGPVDARPAVCRVGARRGPRRGRGHAARRSYRWCKPPTSGSPTTSPISGDITAREAGASLLRERCVRELRSIARVKDDTLTDERAGGKGAGGAGVGVARGPLAFGTKY